MLTSLAMATSVSLCTLARIKEARIAPGQVTLKCPCLANSAGWPYLLVSPGSSADADNWWRSSIGSSILTILGLGLAFLVLFLTVRVATAESVRKTTALITIPTIESEEGWEGKWRGSSDCEIDEFDGTKVLELETSEVWLGRVWNSFLIASEFQVAGYWFLLQNYYQLLDDVTV